MLFKNIEELLRYAVKKQASDIHLKAGIVPVIRKRGVLLPLSMRAKPLDNDAINNLIKPILNKKQINDLEDIKQIDLSHSVSKLGRFRLNIFKQRSTIRVVIRIIPFEIPNLLDLNLPDSVQSLTNLERGLVLVTGATGSGKSTTLAGLINEINLKQHKHIITLEDPIEYLIRDRKSLITQREITTDTNNFHDGLRAALRQDPDIIFIGEMRDKETAEIALNAAETGHLVFSTLHTPDTRETFNRILSMFPHYQHNQIRYQLSTSLQAIVSQRLVLGCEDYFLPAVEVLINNPRIAEMIQTPENTHRIIDVLEENSSVSGMQSFDSHLTEMVNNGKILYNEALKASSNAENFALKFSGISANKDSDKWRAPSEDSIAKNMPSWNKIEGLEIDTIYKRKSKETKK